MSLQDNKDEPRSTDVSLRQGAEGIATSAEFGGVRITSMVEVMDMARLMAVSQQAVPPHLRESAGMCLAVCLQALEWRMSPFAVANKSYVVNDRLGWESQLVHAVVESRAPLRARLRFDYSGEGDERRCIVSGHFRGEAQPHVFTSEPIRKLLPAKNDQGKRKGSPLWDTKPDLQLAYNASRDWARLYCPDVLLGVYTAEELAQFPPGQAPGDLATEVVGEIMPAAEGSLEERLAAQGGSKTGFREGVVEDSLNGKTKRNRKKDTAQPTNPEPEPTTDAGHQPEPEQTAADPQDPEPPADPKPETAKAKPGGKTKPTGKAAEPKTPLEYAEHVKTWLPGIASRVEGEQRWSAEMKMRNAAQVTSETRGPIRQLVDDRLAQLPEGE